MSELVTYTPPSAAELDTILHLATRLSRTNFVPEAYRGKPDETLACMLTGRELGIGQMQALRDIFIQKGRPSMMATLMAQLARRAGHKVTVLKQTDTECVVQIHRRDKQQPEQPVTWTLDDAKTAGLLGKDNWRHYPKDMLWNRCVSRAVRRDCSEVLGGVLYTPEEVGNGETDVTWGEVEVDRTTGEILEDTDRLDGVRVTVQAVSPSVPTFDQIKRLRTPETADRLIRQAGEEFGELVSQAILTLCKSLANRTQARDWWSLAPIKDRREVLEYAVELHNHQQHETIETSGAGRAGHAEFVEMDKSSGEGSADPATTPAPDSPDTQDQPTLHGGDT